MKELSIIVLIGTVLGLTGCATTSPEIAPTQQPPPVQASPTQATENADNDLVGPPSIQAVNTTLPSTSESDIGGTSIGGAVEEGMDETDKSKMLHAMDKAPGKSTHWANAHTNIKYIVTPTKKVKIADKNYCRQYQITAIGANDKEKTIQGVACIAADGNWHVLQT